MKTETEKQRKQREENENLKKIIEEGGNKIYTIRRHVSASGMTRYISVYAIVGGNPQWITRRVHKATGFTWNDRWEALRVHGCGMDMGFHVAYTLGRILYPNGHIKKNGEYEKDGGYAIENRWL
jgi:hypothetical protein